MNFGFTEITMHNLGTIGPLITKIWKFQISLLNSKIVYNKKI